MTVLGANAKPWTYSAVALRKCDNTSIGDARLLNNEVPFRQGWANFTELAISHDGAGYCIDFEVYNFI